MDAQATIIEPVIDLLNKPMDAPPRRFIETQALYGDPVTILQEMGEWTKVELTSQLIHDPMRGWVAYPGYVKSSALRQVDQELEPDLVVTSLWSGQYSIGTKLTSVGYENGYYTVQLPTGETDQVSDEDVREIEMALPFQQLLIYARQFVGCPYVWGGRSGPSHDFPAETGVDCSGLIHLLATLEGKVIPRNSHDQFEYGEHRDPQDLGEGDLLFFSKRENPEKMVHVMLVAGEDVLLEATSKTGCVRVVSAEERFEYSGLSLKSLRAGDLVGDYHVFGAQGLI